MASPATTSYSSTNTKVPVIKHNAERTRFWSRRELINTIGYTDTVFFVIEKLTESTISFWREYIEYQELHTRRNGICDANGFNVGIGDGIHSFEKSLKLYPSEKRGYDTWVAYVLNEPKGTIPAIDQTDPSPFTTCETTDRYFHTELRRSYPKDYLRIEMCFSVFIDDHSPIITHMGIFRNYEWFHAKNSHKYIAHFLHAFSALVCKQIYPDSPKVLMVTHPALKMRSIMFKNMTAAAKALGVPPETVINIGDDENRNRIMTMRKNIALDLPYLASIKECPENIQLEKFTSIKEYERNWILRTATRRGTSVYDEAVSHIDDNKLTYYSSFSELEKDYRYLFPATVEVQSLLHNSSDPWYVEDANQKIEFNRPGWYIHEDMQNHLHALVLDIKTLARIF
jgi:hypothetical protein